MGVFKRKSKEGVEEERHGMSITDAPTGKRIIKAVGPSKREAASLPWEGQGVHPRGNDYFDIKKDAISHIQ